MHFNDRRQSRYKKSAHQRKAHTKAYSDDALANATRKGRGDGDEDSFSDETSDSEPEDVSPPRVVKKPKKSKRPAIGVKKRLTPSSKLKPVKPVEVLRNT